VVLTVVAALSFDQLQHVLAVPPCSSRLP
jgi:hypothetical protein